MRLSVTENYDNRNWLTDDVAQDLIELTSRHLTELAMLACQEADDSSDLTSDLSRSKPSRITAPDAADVRLHQNIVAANGSLQARRPCRRRRFPLDGGLFLGAYAGLLLRRCTCPCRPKARGAQAQLPSGSEIGIPSVFSCLGR